MINHTSPMQSPIQGFKTGLQHNLRQGWVRKRPIEVQPSAVQALGNRVDRKGKALTVKLQGVVEPYFQNN